MQVNRQLVHLKCGELAIKAVAPGMHRAIRRIDDSLGPRLARRLTTPLAADAAYLALKPFEWIARAALRLAVPQYDDVARRVYRDDRPDSV